MAIFEITKETIVPLESTRFDSEGFFERKDIQRHLKEQINILSDDLMVIAEEFSEWTNSSRRIDLLCLDKQANLVIVELKRTDDGGYMELQAIRYAAMISAMTFERLVQAYLQYNSSTITSEEEATQLILDFLGWDSPNQDNFSEDVKIILAAADFSKELTTSVLWLNEYGLDIRCIRLKPYRTLDGRVMIDIQQIIPLPESSEYQTQIRTKEQVEKKYRTERHDLRYKFWDALLAYAKTKTNIHANRKPNTDSWIGGRIGKSGFSLNYVVTQDESRAELYIDFGQHSEERNLSVFQTFQTHKPEIEKVFGEPLVWEELPSRRCCRIRKDISGGWRSPQDEWPDIHHKLTDTMIRLDEALRPYVQNLSA